MNTKKEFEIVNGPSKDLLCDAFKYAYNKAARITIEFSIAAGYTMPPEHPSSAYVPAKIGGFIISSLEHEDGSGESFNIRGYCKADIAKLFGEGTFKAYKYEAYYNTKTRKGTIALLD